MALSLLPVVFMFFVSYSLLNRTLGRWFPRPLEIASEQTQSLMNDFGRSTLPRLRNLARQAQTDVAEPTEKFLKNAFNPASTRSGFSTKTANSFAAASSATISPKIAPPKFASASASWARLIARFSRASKFGKLKEGLSGGPGSDLRHGPPVGTSPQVISPAPIFWRASRKSSRIATNTTKKSKTSALSSARCS